MALQMNPDINRYSENLADKMEKLAKSKEKVEIKRWHAGSDFFMKVAITRFDIAKGFLYTIAMFFVYEERNISETLS